jgi:hypothetical protein
MKPSFRRSETEKRESSNAECIHSESPPKPPFSQEKNAGRERTRERERQIYRESNEYSRTHSAE